MSTKRPVTSHDLLAFKLAGEPHLSPAGDSIAYTLTWIDQDTNQYNSTIYQVKPGAEPVRLTNSDSDSHPQFSPDGGTLAFLSRRSGSSQVWLLPLAAGGEARQLTHIKGGVSQFVWFPNGQALAIIANVTPRHTARGSGRR